MHRNMQKPNDAPMRRSADAAYGETFWGLSNALVGKRYWCAARAAHDAALIDTLIKKGVDVSAIYDGKSISFARKVVLNPDKTKVLFG